MKFFRIAFDWIKNWLSLASLSVKRVDDIPKGYRKGIVYIVGNDNPWLLTFLCPCGCKAEINLNLLEDESPCWTYSVWKGRIKVSPSIRRLKGCKSHFWIKKGRVEWCFD